MRDLVDVLREIKYATVEMEFCEDFNKLQLILNNSNQFVRSFDKIVFDGGNEVYIIEIVARLLKYLRIQNYLDRENKINTQYETQLRKITMYLLLNTDVSFRYDLSEDIRVKHLLNSLPQMSKCLLMHCIWGLDLDRFLYEMISYAPLWFSMQFLDQAIASLSNAKPYEVLERVEAMVRAIYFAICRTDCDWRKINRSRCVEQQRTLGRMFDFVADQLRYFNTPEMTKLERWSKLRKYRYFGFLLKHLLSTTNACLEQYFRKPAIAVRPEMAVYELANDKHVHKESPAQFSQPTENTLSKINSCLLNTLETIIMQVSVSRFIYWAEIDLFKEGEETVTLQELIGEAAYRLSEDLLANAQCQHNIVTHLKQFVMRPKSLAEKAATMSIGKLMLKIDNAHSVDEQCVYLNEFIGRSDRVFGNAECLETIDTYWTLLTGSHVCQMIEYDAREPVDGQEEMDESSEEQVKLRDLILKTVETLPTKDFHHLIKFTLDTFGKEFCRYQKPDHVSKVVELINRLRDTTSTLLQSGSSLSAAGLPGFQQLLFQSPATFYAKLVQSLYDAGTTNEQYVDAIVAIIVRHKTIAQQFMREHLQTLLSGDFEVRRSPLLGQLVTKLYNVSLFEQHEIIQQLLFNGIDEAYGKKNFAALHDLLKLAGTVWLPFISTVSTGKDAAATQKLLANKAALSLGNIVGGLRYNIRDNPSPDVDLITLVVAVIELLEQTLQKLQKLATDEDKQELLMKIEKETPRSTQYYFFKHVYCTSPDIGDTVQPGVVAGNSVPEEVRTRRAAVAAKCLSFSAFMYHEELHSCSDDGKIVAFLTWVFPQCTKTEAISLAKDKLLRSHIQPVAVATIRDLLLRSSHCFEWLRSCTSNYIQCLVQVMLPSVAGQENGTEMCSTSLRSLVELLEHLPRATKERMCEALAGDLANLYRYVRSLDSAVQELTKLECFLGNTAHTNTEQLSQFGVTVKRDAMKDMDTCEPSTAILVGTAMETECTGEQQM